MPDLQQVYAARRIPTAINAGECLAETAHRDAQRPREVIPRPCGDHPEGNGRFTVDDPVEKTVSADQNHCLHPSGALQLSYGATQTGDRAFPDLRHLVPETFQRVRGACSNVCANPGGR